MSRRRIYDPLEWIMRKITITESGCWEYPHRNDSGYGVINYYGPRGRRPYRVHRITYERLVGPIPDGLQIDHLCRNRACCNPAHLEPVESGENTRRGLRKTMQTHCKQGHEYTPENTKMNRLRGRQCRECARAAARAYSRRRDEAVRRAVKALGTTHPAYWREYGYSLKTAERILNELENAS